MTAARLVFFTAIAALAQEAPKVEFEVVSIKPFNPELSQGGIARTTGGSRGRWQARNIRLRDLVRSAYGVNDNQIVGGPKWVDSAGWDIDAKYDPALTQAQFARMIQAMLTDRFHLVFHRETRTLPVYLLEVAKGGPKLKESTATTGGMSAGPKLIKYTNGTMTDLTEQLSSLFDRQVLDRTELKGRYEINLRFASVNADPSLEAAQAETLPSIFRALEEQAGLRLESGKGPVEVLVIDSAEKASEN